MARFDESRLERRWRSPKAVEPNELPSAKKSDRSAIKARIEEHKAGTEPTFEEGLKKKIAEYKAAKLLGAIVVIFMLFQACGCRTSKDWDTKSPILNRTPGVEESPLAKEEKYLLPKATFLTIHALPGFTPYWKTTLTIPLQK